MSAEPRAALTAVAACLALLGCTGGGDPEPTSSSSSSGSTPAQFGCPNGCPSGQTCVVPDNAMTGRCETPPAPIPLHGRCSDCAYCNQPPCDVGLVCRNATCQKP